MGRGQSNLVVCRVVAPPYLEAQGRLVNDLRMEIQGLRTVFRSAKVPL